MHYFVGLRNCNDLIKTKAGLRGRNSHCESYNMYCIHENKIANYKKKPKTNHRANQIHPAVKNDYEQNSNDNATNKHKGYKII